MDIKLDYLSLESFDKDNILSFISSLHSPKFVLVFNCLSDSFSCLEAFQECVDGLDVPFLACRCSGCITPVSVVEDGLVFVGVSGDFEVDTFDVGFDFEDLDGVSEAVLEYLGDSGTLMVFSPTRVTDAPKLNYVLDKVHAEKPGVLLWGGVSVDPHIVASNNGVFEDRLVCAYIKDADFSLNMDTGFSLDKSGKPLEVTKSDMFFISEMNGKNAEDEYCSTIHVKPYLINSVTKLVTRFDAPRTFNKMSKLSKTMYEAILKSTVKLYGYTEKNGITESVGITGARDGKIISAINVPQGTKIYPTISDKETHLAALDRIADKHEDSEALLIASCLLRQFYINFDFEEAKRRLDALGKPYVLAYMGGEVGVGANEELESIHHNCSIQVLGLK